MIHLVNQAELKLLTHEAVTGTEQSANLDTRNYEGNVLVMLSVQAGGTGTSTPVIQDSEDGSSDWAAVDADAIVSPTTGEVTTLSTLTTSASVQTVGLRKDLLRRYVRIAYSGGTTHQVTAVAAGQKKYSGAA